VFKYSANDVPPDGQKALSISLKYSYYKCSYEYDKTTCTYKRFRAGKPHMERITDNQLSAKNIIIQYVKNYTIPNDPEGRQELNTVGSGSGYYISCGRAVKIKWSKDSRNTPTRYTTENGEELVL